MRFRSVLFSLVAFLIICFSNGCGSGAPETGTGQPALPAKPAENTTSPDSGGTPVVLTAPLDDSTRADPARLYAALCARCHGLDGVPVFEGAPNLKELTCPKRAITGTIYSGRGQMPSFGKVLTRPEISRLADYVRAMQENG